MGACCASQLDSNESVHSDHKDNAGKHKEYAHGIDTHDPNNWDAAGEDPELGRWLENVPVLQRVPANQRNKLAGALEEIKFPEGNNVFKQGDRGDRFYIIKSGVAAVQVTLPTGETKEVARLAKGDYFGETALLSEQTRNATVVAADGDLITLSLNSKTFKSFFDNNKTVHLAKRKGVTERGHPATTDQSEAHDTTKSETEKSFIVETVQQSVIFEKLDENQIVQIAEQMWKIKAPAKESLINAGAVGDMMYLIEAGEVRVHEEGHGTPEIRTKGQIVCELALLYSAPSNLTVTTEIDCVLWGINRHHYRRILKKVSKEKAAEYENFLKTVPILNSLLDYERRQVAELLEQQWYEKGHSIVTQGEPGDTFYIVRRGAAVVKKREEGEKAAVEVLNLGPGDFFGERALIKNDVRAASVIVDSDTMECLMLDREGFTNLLGPLGDILTRRIATEYDGVNEETDSLPTDAMGGPVMLDVQLDDLEIVGTLGKGSFGHVQLVKNDTPQYFALKCVNKGHVIQLGQQEHIVNEKNVLASLDSPFVTKLYGTTKDDNYVYFLMEVVLGGELFAYLRDRGAFSDDTARFYAGCVIEAFDHMHSKNIIYRDLKPENLLIDSDGFLKVTDFGFAKVVTDRTWTLCGTPDYLAPEVVSGVGHDKAVDWWTLGVLIFEMLVSYPPFFDEDPMKTYAKIMHGSISYPRSLKRDAVEIIRKLLHPKPTKRMGSIRGGVTAVRQCAWFKNAKNFSWDELKARTCKAPMVPRIRGPEDLSNFEEYSESRSADYPPYYDDGSGWDDNF